MNRPAAEGRGWAVGRLLLAAVALSVAGCGRSAAQRPDRAVMRGAVTLDGQPLGGAVMTVVSAADPTRTSGALVGADGTYRCEDAPVGEVVIGIERLPARTASDGKTGSPPPVPARYRAWATSGLKATVMAARENVVPLALASSSSGP